MSQFTNGDAIRELRKSKAMSQEELSRGICTISAISKIERGIVRPSWPIFKALMEKLGEDPLRFYSDSVPTTSLYLSSLNDRLTDLLLKKDEESNLKAESLILETEEDKYFAHWDSFFYTKLLKKHKAVLSFNRKEYETAYKYAVEALKSYFSDFCEENISEFYYSAVEIDLLNIMATSQFYFVSPEKSTETYLQILASFNNGHTSDDYSRRLKIKMIYNLSKNYGILKEYEKSIPVCDEGIVLCRKVSDLHFLSRFFFNKGYCLLYLKEIEQGKLLMAKALTAFRVSEDDNEISMMESFLKDEFNITLPELKTL